MSSGTPLLEVRQLTIRYGRVEAVSEASISVMDGEFVTIIGNNGAGKSSTLKAIAGVTKPADGEILFCGARIDGMEPHRIVRAGVSLVPEGRVIFADQTVMDNLLLGAYTRSQRGAEVARDIEYVFELFPVLKERVHQLGGSLSGGEQQMLAIARGLLARPKLLMIDEMSLGLAPKVLGALVPVLRNLNREGLAILLVEQLANLALKVADRGYVYENARIIAHGPAAELAKSERVVEAYLGRTA